MKKTGIPSKTCGVIIMAAGQGKRMRSDLPKVLHEVSGQPILFHILNRIQECALAASVAAPVAIVVGHGREKVEAAVRANPDFSKLNITFIHQSEQKGTGHAARCAMDAPWGAALVKAKHPILVLPGDLPLIPTSLVSQMTEPMGRAGVLRLLTCDLPDPKGYGRVVRRGKNGVVLRIVEEKDANDREKEIREVAASIYFFHSPFLQASLHRISNKNAQGEYYLTDLVANASRAKKRIDVLKWGCAEDLRGINDPWELAIAQRSMNERTIQKWAQAGARFIDPWSNQIDVGVEIGEGAVIQRGAILSGKTKIAARAVIGARVILTDVVVGEGAYVKAGTIAEKSVIGARAQVGPYAHLRPDSDVGADSKIGNFVELKKTKIGTHTSVAHLSYLGDAEVGNHVNIGCGFVTCNFDGRVIDGQRKHRTIIEDHVFLGSDCQTIAPIKIGKGAYVASGSTLTDNVEADSLAIARSRQVNKAGYAKKLRQGDHV